MSVFPEDKSPAVEEVLMKRDAAIGPGTEKAALNTNRTPEKFADFSGVFLCAVDFRAALCYKLIGWKRELN